MMKEKAKPVSETELKRLAKALAGTFIQRQDLYAQQLDDGSYVTIYQRLTNRLLVEHLRGEITLGAYLLDPNDRGRFLVLDADDAPDWRRLQALAKILDEQGVSAYLEGSRRGGHLWLFFAQPLAGEVIRRFGGGLLAYFGIGGVELYPKQDRLDSGPGSLIRLPFGIHRSSGRRYSFYLPGGEPLAPTLREQIWAMRTPTTVPESVLAHFTTQAPTADNQLSNRRHTLPEEKLVEAVAGGADLPLSERIKAAVPVRTFVGRYVELSLSGKGLCPFHGDQVASFSVNDEKNYWHCFAGCGGGSVIDFWMRWQECDFTTAVTELAEMLL